MRLRRRPLRNEPSLGLLDNLLKHTIATQQWESTERGRDHWISRAVPPLHGGSTRISAGYDTLTIQTLIPAIIAPSDASEIAAACSLVNRRLRHHLLTITSDGTPSVVTKLTLTGSPKGEAAIVAASVYGNRRLASMLFRGLAAFRRGEGTTHLTPQTNDSDVDVDEHPARFDLTGMPHPQAPFLAAARGTTRSDAEALTLAQIHGRPEHLPPDSHVCAGPVVIHIDGVAECHGCRDPLDNVHPGGSTVSCHPEYFIPGHDCSGCAPPA